MHGIRWRLGVMVPGNNSTIEPEIWRVLPPDAALYASRLMLKGLVTADALRGMEKEIDRSAAELMATVVDVLMIADMVVSFLMEPDWNERRCRSLEQQYGVPCITGWTALRDALRRLGIERFAVVSPYPRELQDLAAGFFAREGYRLTDERTFDFRDMLETPRVSPERLEALVGQLDLSDAQAVALLSTDLPTFASIARLEERLGLPVLSQNQTMLWSALRTIGNPTPIPGLGQLLEA